MSPGPHSLQTFWERISLSANGCRLSLACGHITPVFETSVSAPGGSAAKESTCNVGDLGSISGLGTSPGGGHGNPLQYSCLENPHGQRSLAGYSPWGHKESDMTEQLSTHIYAHIHKTLFIHKLTENHCPNPSLLAYKSFSSPAFGKEV